VDIKSLVRDVVLDIKQLFTAPSHVKSALSAWTRPPDGG